MNKVLIIFCGLFVILAVSCFDAETNYPARSSGNVFVHNDTSSGQTITRITITSDPALYGATTTYHNNRVSILQGSKSQGFELSISYDERLGILWNRFRVTITLDDNSTKFIDIRVYEDIDTNLRYNGTDIIEDSI